jgi:hypothetical protein
VSADQVILPSGANAAEAAAISAAIERFLGDTAVAPPPADEGMNPWLKAALAEGVSAKDSFGPGDPADLF